VQFVFRQIGLKLETLDIVVFVVGIVKYHGENRVGIELFNPDNILFEMGTQVKPAKPGLPVG
jgi:hypothetical protein